MFYRLTGVNLLHSWLQFIVFGARTEYYSKILSPFGNKRYDQILGTESRRTLNEFAAAILIVLIKQYTTELGTRQHGIQITYDTKETLEMNVIDTQLIILSSKRNYPLGVSPKVVRVLESERVYSSLLLTWINCNPSMVRLSDTRWSVGFYHISTVSNG